MIPDEAVETAARAHYETNGGHWGDAIPEYRAVALDDMRAALEAAAPVMMAGAWAEGLKVGIRLQAEYARDPLTNPGVIRNPYGNQK